MIKVALFDVPLSQPVPRYTVETLSDVLSSEALVAWDRDTGGEEADVTQVSLCTNYRGTPQEYCHGPYEVMLCNDRFWRYLYTGQWILVMENGYTTSKAFLDLQRPGQHA